MEVKIIVPKFPNGIAIGEERENLAVPVVVDYTAWIEQHGAGALQILLQRPQDADPYPVTVTNDNGEAVWTPNETDMAFKGRGEIQLVYTAGDVIERSPVIMVISGRSLVAAGDPPDPYETWLESLTELAAETLVNAQSAANSAEEATDAANEAEQHASQAAESAQSADESAQAAEASEQAAGNSATIARAKAAEAAEAAQIAGENADYAMHQSIAAGDSAASAHDDAESAAQSAEDAQAAASAAQTAASAAAASASAAAGSADDAAATVTEVETKGAEQIAAINQAGTTQIAAVDAAGAAQVQAIEDKGEEVIASIPSDYTELADEVSDLKSSLDGSIRDISVEYNPYTKRNWRVGYISPTTGANATATNRISTNTNVFFNPLDGVTYLTAKTGYKFFVFAYAQDGTYEGAWNGTTFVKSWNYISATVFNILAYPAYKFRVFLLRNDDADMTTAEFDKLNVFYTVTDAQGYRGILHQNNLAEDTTKVKGYLGASGAIVPPSEQVGRETTTDFIPVESGKTYVFTMFVDSTVEFWARICFYDASKSYTSRVDYNAATGAWMNFNYLTTKQTIPAGSFYVRVSTRHGFSLVTNGVTEWDYSVSPIDIRRHWNYRPKQDYFVRTVNHRGYGRIAPENTAPAFELSADLGFWGVENDIRFTSDGVPVLLHDDTINRTARNEDGTEIAQTINIRDITYEEALTYDFGIRMGEQYKGTRIMTFEQFVSLCRKKSLNMYNEIKAGTEAQVASLVHTVKRYGMQKHCTWISFSTTYLEQVCRYDANARIGLIFSTFRQSNISTLTALQTATNTVFADISLDNNSTLNDSVIDALIGANLELEMYTPNLSSVMQNLNPYVTGVTSDWLIAGDVLYTGRNDIIVLD